MVQCEFRDVTAHITECVSNVKRAQNVFSWIPILNQGCQPWEIDFLTIYQKLPKFSLLNGIFSLLKHELVTDYFKQFPYFAEN